MTQRVNNAIFLKRLLYVKLTLCIKWNIAVVCGSEMPERQN